MIFKINRIYNENCLKTMSRMANDFIDLVITSPPYDNLRDYHGYTFDFKSIAQELCRVIKNGGVLVWVVGDATIKGSETGNSFKQVLYFKKVGFNIHDTMIYKKINYIPLTHNRYEQAFEYMFILSKGRPKTFNPILIECKTKGSRTDKRTFYQKSEDNLPSVGHKNKKVKEHKQASNVWELSTHCGAKGHPAQFPEKLANDHIISWSNKGDLVYDPMMGSGTTLKMAIINKRKFIGSEISEEYCEITKQRLNQTYKDLKIQSEGNKNGRN